MYDIYYGRYRDTDQTVLSKQLLNSIYGRVSMNRDVKNVVVNADSSVTVFYTDGSSTKIGNGFVESGRQSALHKIKNVIFNDPATIVFWNDGTKTVVKCGKDDKFDPEKGLAMAISKYFFANAGCYNDVFKKWIPKKETVEVDGDKN
jgi:hypothetical protein